MEKSWQIYKFITYKLFANKYGSETECIIPAAGVSVLVRHNIQTVTSCFPQLLSFIAYILYLSLWYLFRFSLPIAFLTLVSKSV
jgi:hypothetical protein